MSVLIPSPVRRSTVTLALTAFLAAGYLGGTVHAQSVATPLWMRDSIYSSVLGETRFLRISLPTGYETREYATEQYPVLIVLDAQANIPFAAAVANARALGGTNAPAMPRLLIVGVETPNPSRFRDMTLPSAGGAKRDDGGGGAQAFLRFLTTELQPYLAGRYRTQPFVILAGHSLTGFFTAWAFGQAPAFVSGAIALSPSLFERERVLEGIAARGAPGRLILVTGTAEHGLDAAAQSFAAAVRARNPAGLVFEHERIPDVSHDHTTTLGMIPGLLFIFRPVSLAGYQVEFADDNSHWLSTFSAAFDSTRVAYLRGARELGLPRRLPLSFLTSQAQFYQDSTTAPLRLRLCQELITSYPALTTGFECAGDAHMRLGRSAEAIVDYRRAIDVARAAGDSATADRLMRKVPRGSP